MRDGIVYEKIVVVTRHTELEGLLERFSTRGRARFYIEQMGVSFTPYEAADAAQQNAFSYLQSAIPRGVRVQYVEREFLPNFTFGAKDCVVVLGVDGLVVNVAKYLDGQPLVAFNPDPGKIDGVLLPFNVRQAKEVLSQVVRGKFQAKRITLAKAQLNDGQVLYAVNDFFVGRRTHASARYSIGWRGRLENQSSSGIIVSTGTGSTGWLKSIVAGAVGIAAIYKPPEEAINQPVDTHFDWEAERLVFCVREPFGSKTTSTRIVHGEIAMGEILQIVSQMPQEGVIFSDGVEDDYLEFNSGSIASISLAEKKVQLVTSAYIQAQFR